MAGIRLEWAQFGDFDSFDVLRSNSPMDVNSLPSPIVSGLPTMYYVDTTVVEGATYYYRVVAWRDGVSKLSGEIKVKASGGDEHWDKVVALLHFDGDFTDETGMPWTASGGATTTSEGAKFGMSGNFPGGSHDYIASSSPVNFGDEDFTVECFMQARTASQGTLATNRDGGEIGWLLRLEANGAIRFSNIGTSQTSVVSAPGVIAPLVWTHVAFAKDGSTGRLFVGGVLVASSTFKAAVASSRAVSIGSTRHDAGNYRSFNGLLDEFRITKGVARYTENFDPPDSPFPSY